MKCLIFIGLLFLSKNNLYAQDWPNLGRYRDDDIKLSTETNPGDRVVFMGNSITDFWIQASPDFFADNDFVDRGVSGQTSPQMLLRFRQDVIDLRPRAVVILAGTNDLAGNTGPTTLKMIEDNIQSMAELAAANHMHALLCSVLPTSDFIGRPPKRIDSLNAWIKDYAAANSRSMSYLDYYAAFVDDRKGMKSEFTDDGLHPNKAGYVVLEKLALAEIRKFVKKVK